MSNRPKYRVFRRLLGAALAAGLALGATAAEADGRGHDRGYHGRDYQERGHRDRGDYRGERHHRDYRGDRRHGDRRHGDYRRGPPPRVVVVPNRRHYHDRHYDRRVVIVRPGPYHHRYYPAPRYRRPPPPQWLGLNFLFHLNSHQQDAYEGAWQRSVAAPVGQPVSWSTGNATGRLVAVNEGYAHDDRYCREFQQSVTIDRRTEQAYGTACLQPDGAWEVVDAR